MSAKQWLEESQSQKQILVFVRHRGCTFCREALTELSKNLEALESKGLKIRVIHMGPPEASEMMRDEFQLKTIEIISDPERQFYRQFDIKRANLVEAIGPKVLWRGIVGGSLFKYGVGKLEGDGFQQGGVLLLDQGQRKVLHQPRHTGDVENWSEILSQL